MSSISLISSSYWIYTGTGRSIHSGISSRSNFDSDGREFGKSALFGLNVESFRTIGRRFYMLVTANWLLVSPRYSYRIGW